MITGYWDLSTEGNAVGFPQVLKLYGVLSTLVMWAWAMSPEMVSLETINSLGVLFLAIGCLLCVYAGGYMEDMRLFKIALFPAKEDLPPAEKASDCVPTNWHDELLVHYSEVDLSGCDSRQVELLLILVRQRVKEWELNEQPRRLAGSSESGTAAFGQGRCGADSSVSASDDCVDGGQSNGGRSAIVTVPQVTRQEVRHGGRTEPATPQ